MPIYDRASGQEYVKHVLENTGAKNKQYDTDLDGVIASDRVKDAVETYHVYDNVFTTDSYDFVLVTSFTLDGSKLSISKVVVQFRAVSGNAEVKVARVHSFPGSETYRESRTSLTATTSTVTETFIFHNPGFVERIEIYLRSRYGTGTAEISKVEVYSKLAKPVG